MLVLGSVIFKGYIVGRVVECVGFTGSGNYSISVWTKSVEQLAEVWTNRFSRIQEAWAYSVSGAEWVVLNKEPLQNWQTPWQTSNLVVEWFLQKTSTAGGWLTKPLKPPRIMASKLHSKYEKWCMFFQDSRSPSPQKAGSQFLVRVFFRDVPKRFFSATHIHTWKNDGNSKRRHVHMSQLL